MVFPPVINIGFPTLGHSWFTNREAAPSSPRELGIHTVFDRDDPGGPLRLHVLGPPPGARQLADHPFGFEDFAGEAGLGRRPARHVLERLLGYAVLDAGYHVRSVLNTDWAAINYTFLEYKLQRMSAMLPAYTQEQVDFIEQVTADGPLLASSVKLAGRRPVPAAGQGPAPRLPRSPWCGPPGPQHPGA